MLGYAAMNRTLRERDPPRRCNRDIRQTTWEREGIERVAALTERNFEDLHAILEWNLDHGIRFYRCSSTLVPWNSQFELPELPNYDLPPRARDRLVVENDDKASLWGVTELVDAVSEVVEIPVTFDYHHHSFTSRGRSYREGFAAARDTWGDVRPITHYSEPALLHGESEARPQDHAEHVAAVPDWLRDRSDVMVESHGKERSLLRLRDRTSA